MHLWRLVVWITRTWLTEGIKNSIRTQYEEKLETHKANMKAQSDIELEKLRAKLQEESARNHAVFSRLHEQRATIFSETYSRLIELHSCLSKYVNPLELVGEPKKDEKCKDLVDVHDDFFKYFSSHQIFFPKNTSDKINQINEDIVRIGSKFRNVSEPGVHVNSLEEWLK